MPAYGHLVLSKRRDNPIIFAAWEQPKGRAEDFRETFRSVRSA